MAAKAFFIFAVFAACILAWAAAADRYVFVYNSQDGCIYRVDGFGAEPTVIKCSIANSAIGAHKGWVYGVKTTALSAEVTQSTIYRFSQSGEDEEALPISTTSTIRAIDFNDDYMFVNIAGEIWQYGYNGLFGTLVKAPSSTPYDVVGGTRFHYYITRDGTNNKVHGVDKDNGETRTIYTSTSVDHTIYATELDDKLWVSENTVIRKMDRDGEDPSDLNGGATFNNVISLDKYDDYNLLVIDQGVSHIVYTVGIKTGTKVLVTRSIAAPTAAVSDEVQDPDLSSTSALNVSSFFALAVALLAMFAALL